MSIANQEATRVVEYFRCWLGNQVGGGTWDTGFLAIPADTPDERIDEVIRRAVSRVPWESEAPVLVGYYADGSIDFDIGGEG
ncbi:MAG: hypothetical protein K8T91_10845 [Planctomycetes bacterium]|nr:hypothetical protein [Planctomycetota bacterium]